MTDGLTTPELTPNAGAPTAPTQAVVPEPIEYDTPIIDDGLPFTPEIVGGNAS
jgi:hypothetical protein